MDEKEILGIGQKKVLTKEVEVKKALSNKTLTLGIGTEFFAGADGFAHFKNGMITKLETAPKGFSTEGLAEWIFLCLRNSLPGFPEMLEDYDLAKADFEEVVSEALSELGMYEAKKE